MVCTGELWTGVAFVLKYPEVQADTPPSYAASFHAGAEAAYGVLLYVHHRYGRRLVFELGREF